MNYGVSSMTAPLQRVALRRPGASMQAASASEWHYGPSFDKGKVEDEYAAFLRLLEAADCEILWMDGDDRGNADSVFTYDASLMTPAGAILMKPGKALRGGEQELHREFYRANDIPILGEITGDGSAEAGDTLWIDDRTLAVGRSFRTNQSGIEQIAALLEPAGVVVHAFDLPVFYGADACLHLMSLLSMVDTRKAAVILPLLPVGLYQLLLDRGYELIELPRDEFDDSLTLSANILAVAPGRCVMIDGYPRTREALEANSVQVSVFHGDAICMGCEGGPTCMSRPILRA